MELEGMIFWGFVATFAAWVFAEFRGSRLTRIIFGITGMILLAVFTPTIKQWEVFGHAQGLLLIDRKLEAGNVSEVRRAIRVHTEVYATKGSRAAVSSLLRVLNEAKPPDVSVAREASNSGQSPIKGPGDSLKTQRDHDQTRTRLLCMGQALDAREHHQPRPSTVRDRHARHRPARRE